jgi:large subunit ribosomal protein L5
MTNENPMKKIKIAKVVVNIGLGKNIKDIEKATTLIEKLTGTKSVKTLSTRKARTFGVGKNRTVGVKVTLRGKNKIDFIKKTIFPLDNTLSKKCFNDEGNFGYGLKEYLEVPGEKYDPAIGIMGFSVNICLERPGYRIKRRKLKTKKIPKTHKISKDEAIEFAKKELNITIV